MDLCQSCGGELLPLVFGYPSPEMMKAATRGGAVAEGVQHGQAAQRARLPATRSGGRSGVVLVPQETVVARASE